jgi:hypothetical protein
MTRSKLIGAWLAAALLSWSGSTLPGETPPRAAQPGSASDRVILITLDGTRSEEMFSGLDPVILKSTLRDRQTLEGTATYERFWAETPEQRREKLMPFFWGTLMAAHGSIAGDRALGSSVSLVNRHWFSYPGYAEILLGEAHDDVIKSNDSVQNPYPTVLETLREHLSLPRQGVATFASWGVFNYIVEHTEGATTVDAGPAEAAPANARLREWAALQRETLPPWSDVRSDIFTFKFAMAHLEASRPRVLYLAFDETDDWAHDGRYDRLLDAYARTDRYLEELWTWLQSQPDYRGRTHLLLTTDHGRGRTVADWRDHGAKVPGADVVWAAFVSPRMTARGQWRNHAPLTSSQIAATLAGWMGVDWRAIRPAAGPAIEGTQ